jgi:maleate isomerase
VAAAFLTVDEVKVSIGTMFNAIPTNLVDGLMSTNATDAASPPAILGLIWPDDGLGILDYEMLRLGTWLATRGRSVGVMVEHSVAGRSHTRADLLQTGELEALEGPARRLAASGAQAIAWACTSGSFIGGLGWTRAQAAGLERAGGRPVTSATLALIDALEALGASRVDLLGAYPEEITAALAGCLEDAGITVGDSAALGSEDATVSFRLDLKAELTKFVERSGRRSDPIVIPDTAINTLDLVDELEGIAGRPVVTANQAVLWRGLSLLGVDPAVAGAGTLFRLSSAVPPAVTP